MSRGSVTPNTDPNPVVDEGAPKNTGEINSALYLCDMMDVKFIVAAPEELYYQGWGQECAQPKMVRCTWELRTTDSESKPVVIKFDLTEGDSSLILGINFLQFADTCNLQDPRIIRFKRPRDDTMRTMATYIAPDHTGNNRLQLEVVPHANNSCRALLAVPLRMYAVV